MEVVINQKALKKIQSIAKYISEEFETPEKGRKYVLRLIEFGFSLGHSIPTKNALCKYKKFRMKHWNCITFNKKWGFAYQIKDNKVLIEEIALGKLLK